MAGGLGKNGPLERMLEHYVVLSKKITKQIKTPPPATGRIPKAWRSSLKFLIVFFFFKGSQVGDKMLAKGQLAFFNTQ